MDHLKDSGIIAVWLSPTADFDYDISDIRDADPMLEHWLTSMHCS
jgi:glycosidase